MATALMRSIMTSYEGEALSDRLAQEMERRGHNPSEAARVMGTDKERIGQWLRVGVPSEIKYYVALAKYLGVDMTELRVLLGAQLMKQAARREKDRR